MQGDWNFAFIQKMNLISSKLDLKRVVQDYII
jgi:hypothetical protein